MSSSSSGETDDHCFLRPLRPPVVLDVVAAGAAVSVPAKPSLIEHSSQYQFSGRGGLRFTHERWNCEEEERGHDNDNANANNAQQRQ